MKIVLLSGGSGERLWSLSNTTMSKQFLKVLENKESMLQRVYRQIGLYYSSDDIYIVAPEIQTELILTQIPIDERHLIIEPSRRGTYAAIRLASAYLQNYGDICVIPVDSYVNDNFFGIIQQFPHNDKISLIGIEPTYPSEKYGYIVPNKVGYNFKEKPDSQLAEKYISEGALWNAGIFSFNTNIFQDNYSDLVKNYDSLENTSFDYAVLEQQHDFNIITYSGAWKDLGTWNTFSEEMHIENKNVVINNCSNTHVINYLDKFTIVSGINDSMIVLTEDGILISSKEDTKYLKQFIPHDRPFYEEKRWGEYRVIRKSDNYLVKELSLLPYKEISYQSHDHRKESWTIVDGDGTMVIDNKENTVTIGDTINIAKKQKHKIIAGENGVKILEVQIGSILEESDIIRYD